MKNISELKPVILTIFGGNGDLTWRKLMPALYNLYVDKYLPDKFRILSVDLKDLTAADYHARLLDGVNKFSRRGKADKEKWKAFEKEIDYVRADISDDKSYTKLNGIIEKIEKDWKGGDEEIIRIFYMAVSPGFIKVIAQHLDKAGIAANSERHRIVVEKPFGHDVESAIDLNRILRGIFSEDQVYRIDHFLGKETVQNIMAIRFANVLFEPLWNRNYIEQVQIHVAEQMGVGSRAPYYEQAGVVRDMVQNHILQLLCLTAMEPPVNLHADSVRDKKLEVLHAIRRYSEEEVYVNTVRGQYGEGWIEGKEVKEYRKEQNVDPDSQTETFAAMRFFIDNWRWQGVPFLVRTGKRLQKNTSYIVIQFREVPHRIFSAGVRELLNPNLMVIGIQPQMGVRIHFQTKKAGLDMRLNPVDMIYNYSDTYTHDPPDAYETLLNDIMLGDATLFMRADQIEESWRCIMPVINVWENNPPQKFPNYSAGSWGPAESDALIAHSGRYWHTFAEPLASTGLIGEVR